MKKTIMAIVTGTLLTAVPVFAAPLSDVQEGQTVLGYNHYNLDQNGNSVKDDSFYLEAGVAPKVIVGVERNGYAFPNNYDAKTTDVYAQYKVNDNVRLIAGNRDFSNGGGDKFFYGVGLSANLAQNVDGYVSATTNSRYTEWQTGVNYNMDNQTTLNVGYKSYKEDGSSRLDGVGFGISHKF
ncbi:MAG: hypothetical protein E6713_03790 [Sporomusaceae bacterium]|nr:hypothetical protein [Sporomusaceae bacterium]